MLVFDAFPKRPLKLTGYLTSWGLLGWVMFAVLSIFVLLPLSFLLSRSLLQFVDDYRLQASGVIAREPAASNYEVISMLAVDFDLDYVTQQGATHHEGVMFLPMLFPPDRSKPLIVRYDPAAPSHFSTSWGAQRLVHRTIMFLGLVSAIGYAVFLALAARRQRRQSERALAAVAAEPQSCTANVILQKKRLKETEISYSWVDTTGIQQIGSRTYYMFNEPFWLDAQKSKFMILIRPEGPDGSGSVAVALDAKLSWISLTDGERERIFAARDQAVKTTLEAGDLIQATSSASTTETTPESGSPLQMAAAQLSIALNEIVVGLLANTSVNAPRAHAIAARLEPHVKDYDRAVFSLRSRELASDALSELIRSGAAENASVQLDPRDERNEAFDYGVGRAVARYREYKTIFRESKYRNDAL